MDIQPSELKERLSRNEDLNIVDVREEWEWEENNIGAKNIPLGSIPNRLDELEQYKEQELILHCRSGARSGQAQKFLQQQGFKNVRNLLGGIVAYQASPDA
jgi:rhodanese-related sulfurtransferase